MLLRLLTSLMLSSITTTVNFPALLMEPYSGSDPDVGKSIEYMVTSKGYPFERHRVTTEDGYILEMHRIPHGRQACSVPCSRQPVFLMSGFLVASITFVLNSPRQSLGFVLADHGYDVWLGNVRGNTYGKNHRKFSNASREFWNFSFHEFGAYDGPAQIDHVLKQTKRDSLFYVGLSQGALMYFIMMSERPEYNAKVKAMAGLAPFRKMPNFKVPFLEVIATRGNGFLNGLYSSGVYEVMPRDFLAAKGARALCAFPSGRSVCAFLADFMFNMGHTHTNHSRYPVYMSHLPSGTSIKNMIHLSQLVISKNAQKYDYGPEGNREKYGQSDPPHYRLDNVANDIGIFWSRGDKFVPPEDVDELIRELGPRVKMKHFVDDPEYRHFHFGVGTVNHEAWHEELLEFLGRYSDHVRSMRLPAGTC
ncbi:lipase member J-like [Ixodes scapularis]|uniref:lipase member J-like n=1 Tax=Ixodes scapularis TaxID=6945 RepID=UPI001C38D729|nr:lipase member J-like [Ixodes scapularis]